MNTRRRVPLDVPPEKKQLFEEHMRLITRGTSHLFMMAVDQKMEHLLADFHGKDLPSEIINPEHIFSIARAGHIGCLALPVGLITRYAAPRDGIVYIAKLNGKTDLISITEQDPFSAQLWNVEDVVQIAQENSLTLAGVGFTIYLGSQYEAEMLAHAAQIVRDAHAHGLIAILWIYPRGKAIQDGCAGKLIAGAAGVANCLGADFVKVHVPHDDKEYTSLEWLSLAQQHAGNTDVICSGGPRQEPRDLLKHVHEQLTTAQIGGCALGRSIFQNTLSEAIALTQALEELLYKSGSLEKALSLLK